jgi:hypothetical protein
MAEIVEALNGGDADALKAMFTDQARLEHSAEIDSGIGALLATFSVGEVAWDGPEGIPNVSELKIDGRAAVLIGSSYTVRSGGDRYRVLFLEFARNEIDPDNVGVYALGAVRQTEAEDSWQELAMHSWALGFDTDTEASAPPGVFQLAAVAPDERMSAITNALNAHDVDALLGMFAGNALQNFGAELEVGLADLSSLLDAGDLRWLSGDGGAIVYQRIAGDQRETLLTAFYTVSHGEEEYRVVFADLMESTIDQRRIGLYAIGVSPVADHPQYVPEGYLYHWAAALRLGADLVPGVHLPDSVAP